MSDINSDPGKYAVIENITVTSDGVVQTTDQTHVYYYTGDILSGMAHVQKTPNSAIITVEED